MRSRRRSHATTAVRSPGSRPIANPSCGSCANIAMPCRRSTRNRFRRTCSPRPGRRGTRPWSWGDFGYRNAQATVLAPTGTIGFMMDCDTTGVEPDIALVKYKKLVGGGLMKIVNQTVPMALEKLGYTKPEVEAIVHYIDENEMIEGAPFLKDEHLPVFDCAFKPASGERSIHYMGHIRMMGATQPFISGAISKTVNVPREATVEDIEKAYVESWRLGAKAISIYRDGSKRTQPLNTSKAQVADTRNVTEVREVVKEVVKIVETPKRRKLPDERRAITHKFDVAGHEGYITVGMFEDGTPGEIFLVMAKEGSTISGFADAFAQAISYALQYGVPLQALVDKFSHARFEPSGMTRNLFSYTHLTLPTSDLV